MSVDLGKLTVPGTTSLWIQCNDYSTHTTAQESFENIMLSKRSQP